MENLFIARQPIYDRNMNVMGYELLYRSGNMDYAQFDDGNLASCETILNSFMHIGIDTLTGSSLAFVNLPQLFITNEALTPMLREQCVLEILEDVKPTAEVIEGLKRLKHECYLIALDDFEFNDNTEKFLKFADFVKLEVLDKSEQEISLQLDQLKAYPVKIVAEKVQTQEMQQICENLGFDYFQGFFFCRPQVVTQKTMPASKAVVFNLLSKLQNPDVDFNEIEAILAQDVSLSYKLLRYINSAAFAFRREIDSLKDAAVLLGLSNIKNWVTLILMSKLTDDKPTELIVIAMIRGKMCELLANKLNPKISPQMFIIGLFSILDALMDTPMIELLDDITLSIPAKMALLDQSGEHGEIYKKVLMYEQMEWNQLANTDIPPGELAQAYLTAVHWADESMKAIA